MTTQRVYQITSVAIFIPSVMLVRGALELHYYTPMGPGPGFFPFWLALILALLSVITFLEATFGEAARELARGNTDFASDRAGLFRLVTLLLALAGAAFFLERVGYGATMFVMNAVVLWALGTRNPLTILVVAAVGSFGIEYVFSHWLNVPLPSEDLPGLCPSWLCGA
ncbi:tripartite tricarboxylate transporter TctB family protein [Ancylobacter mangrovi]|uniref:tripartite tricarboxylate transporter TctB family protein n=1 Tax=Ancylobacter mangrovi TaxID=2972472 RepID=UPI0021622185|nr:tripartite tricarboxylate transporter TctB family protein [Ancylobacter mangrovi]MCS0500803.1 tripartite tricarboxylate transporter TctB family protein [Ancylobacter mangrovi]